MNAFDYNALGQLESATGPLGTVSYQYGGRRTRVTWPDGFYVEYDYNVTGAMTRVRENGATSGLGLLAVYGYDDLGRRTSLDRGNGVSTMYGYDAASRLDSLTHDLPGAVNDLTVTFDHNPAGQITRRVASSDLYSWTAQASVTTTAVVNGRNQITSQGGIGFSHDDRGNLTSDGVNTYGYDVDNRLTTAPGGAILDYDAAGRLYEVASSTQAATRFLYDGSDLIAEYDAAGNLLRRYVHGAGIDEPPVWYEGTGTADRRWLVADERGSVIAATDAAGGVATLYTYNAYGIPGGSNAGRFQYTGQTWIEAAGLYYYKSRFYDPTLGRFLQPDRIGYSGGLNLYGYVTGDPVNLIDPFGMDEACPDPDGCIVVEGIPSDDTYYREQFRNIVVGGGGGGAFVDQASWLGGLLSLGLGQQSEAESGDEGETEEEPHQDPRCSQRLPDGSTVNENVRELMIALSIEHMGGGSGTNTYIVWLLNVMPGGRQDYKLQTGVSEMIGSFNFGATGSIFHDPKTLLSGAGVVQLITDPSSSNGGIPFAMPPFGDESVDQGHIKAGIAGGCG